MMLSACAESPTGMAREARVAMSFLTPATVRTVVVEVSGPGLSPAVVLNIPVGADSTARDTLMLTAGAGRRFMVTALDSAGVTTHRADTTITLQAGVNAPLAMRLDQLASTLGITVTFAGTRVTVSDTSTRTLAAGDTTSIEALAIRTNGDTVPSDSLKWGSSNPAIATVVRGLVSAVRPGQAVVSASFAGAAVQVRIDVPGNTSCRALLAENPALVSGTYELRPSLSSTRVVTAYCDMHTDGGGWTKVLGHVVTDDVARLNTSDSLWNGIRLAAVDSGSVRPDNLQQMRNTRGGTELRFLCEKPSTGRRLHIKTNAPQVLDYFFGVSDVGPSSVGTFVMMSDDSSIMSRVPESWGDVVGGAWGWGATASRIERMVNHPIFIESERTWLLYEWTVGTVRNECDDLINNNPSANGSWSVWIR